MTPPQPNSMSSGCAPKASSGASSDFGIGFIGTVNSIAADKSDFRRVFLPKIGLFPRPGNVMRAAHDRLHPAQPRIARRTNLLLGERRHRQSDKRIAAGV